MEKTILKYLEEILESPASEVLTGYQKQAIDAVAELLSVCNYDRLCEFAKAEKDGRLVVLPCKPDATYYQWKRGDDCPSTSRFSGVFIDEDGTVHYKAWEDFQIEDFGKTVFLSYEDVKAAYLAMKE